MSRLAAMSWLLLCLGCMGFSQVAAAAIRTVVEPRLVDEMETVRLTLRADGASRGDAPDLSPLERDFEVLGTQTSSRIRIVNGRTTSLLEYQINLRPRRTGEIIIPALKMGDQTSKEIRLVVRPLDPSVRRTIEQLVFFESELNTDPVYVQAETILSRRLHYSSGVQIYSDLPGIPQVENAVVIPLGDAKSSSILHQGRRYSVIEQRFAIFPERSGTLEIPSISVTSSVRMQTGGRTRRSGIRVSTQAMTVEVLAVPETYPADQPWLPAKKVELQQDWKPRSATWDVGEPVSWELGLSVVGNTASAIPPLGATPPASHFKVYPEAPIMAEDATGESVIGQRSETYALIPTAPGQIVLPSLAVTWWDTTTDQLQVTELNPRSVTIVGEATPDVQIRAPADSAAARTTVAESTWSLGQVSAAFIAIIVAIVVAISLAVRYLVLPTMQRDTPLARAVRPIWQRVSAARTSAETTSLRALERACRGSDLVLIRRALNTYLAAVYSCSVSLALRQFRRDTDAAALLDELNATLYAGTADQQDTSTPAESARQRIDPIDILLLAKRAKRSRRSIKKAPLPPLFST